MGEIRKNFSRLSQVVNEEPEIKKLKEKMQAAQKAYMAAFEAAMKKADPDIMAQYESSREAARKRMRGVRRPADSARPSSGYDQLTEEERKKLFEARKQAMGAPAVKDARQKRNSARTEEGRKAADEEYKSALREVMLETDKSLEGLLDKLEGRLSEPKDVSEKN